MHRPVVVTSLITWIMFPIPVLVDQSERHVVRHQMSVTKAVCGGMLNCFSASERVVKYNVSDLMYRSGMVIDLTIGQIAAYIWNV